MHFNNIKGILRQNKLKTILLILITFLSALLIVTSINMLKFPDSKSQQSSDKNQEQNKNKQANNSQDKNSDKPSDNNDNNNGDNNQNNQSSPENSNDSQDQGNGENNNNNDFNGDYGDNDADLEDNGRFNEDNGLQDGKEDDFGNWFDDEEPNEDNLPEGSDNSENGQPGKKYVIPYELRKKLKSKLPEFNIDLSKENSLPNDKYFGDSNSFSVKTTNDPNHYAVFEVLGNNKGSFLKLTVQDSYTNSSWKPASDRPYNVYSFNDYEGLDSLKIKLVKPGNGFIPVLSQMKGLRVPVPGVLNFPYEGVFYTDFSINDVYEVYFDKPVPGKEELQHCTTSNIDYNIQNLDELKTLTDSIVKGIDKPYKKIEAIEEYLKSNFEIGDVKAKSNQDALSRFFQEKKGDHLDFVSAFVTLLRCAKIPARLVTGYRINPSVNYQIVYSDQLCVYPEVSFDEYGWVALDYFAQIKKYKPPVKTITKITKLDSTALKGNGFTVSGTVKPVKGRTTISDMTVLIYMRKNKNDSSLSYSKCTVENGKFEVECPIDAGVDVGSYQIIATTLADKKYTESSSDPELKVMAETTMSINTPGLILSERSFKLDVSLFETLSKKPVSDENIKISTSKANYIEKVVDGKIEKNIKISIDKTTKLHKSYLFAGKYLSSITCEFMGSEYYLKSVNNSEVQVLMIFWNRIIIFIIVLITLTAAIILFRRRKTITSPDYTEKWINFENLYNNVPINASLMSSKYSSQPLQILFPEIVPPFCDVWGLNDVLKIQFSDPSGNYDELNFRFSKKGYVSISVSSKDSSKSIASREIKIVSYSEEIISLGKELFNKLNDKYGIITKKLTPREIARTLNGLKSTYSSDDLDNLAAILEKAIYSSNDVGRKDYERFYMILMIEGCNNEQPR